MTAPITRNRIMFDLKFLGWRLECNIPVNVSMEESIECPYHKKQVNDLKFLGWKLECNILV